MIANINIIHTHFVVKRIPALGCKVRKMTKMRFCFMNNQTTDTLGMPVGQHSVDKSLNTKVQEANKDTGKHLDLMFRKIRVD